MAITIGDAYLIPVVIKQGDTVITDEIADGVKIAFKNSVCSYPNGGLTCEDGVWYFPLTQKLSNQFTAGKCDFQVQVKIGEDVISSKIKQVEIWDSIIKGEW